MMKVRQKCMGNCGQRTGRGAAFKGKLEVGGPSISYDAALIAFIFLNWLQIVVAFFYMRLLLI